MANSRKVVITLEDNQKWGINMLDADNKVVKMVDTTEFNDISAMSAAWIMHGITDFNYRVTEIR